jgi:hypothetical protein
MTTTSARFAPIRLASALSRAARGRVAYLFASGIDPAQARREAVTSIGRAVGYEASVISSVDMLVLLGLALVLTLVIAFGLERDAYSETARPAFAFLASRPPYELR